MWLCPSRGRPKNLQRLIDAYYETDAKTRMIVRLDVDDERIGEYKSLYSRKTG